jgi:hypothetical protein
MRPSCIYCCGSVDTTEVALTGVCECRTEQIDEMPEEDELEEERLVEARAPLSIGERLLLRHQPVGVEAQPEAGGSWSMRDQLSEKIRGEQVNRDGRPAPQTALSQPPGLPGFGSRSPSPFLP